MAKARARFVGVSAAAGLARVGALENFAWFSDASKLLLCFLMLVGRLEVFVILVLFSPRFWRSG